MYIILSESLYLAWNKGCKTIT